MALTLSSQSKHFGGTLSKYTHASTSTKTTMAFNVFVPEGASAQNKVPVLYCLGGLTATEDNFAQKSGFGARASQYGIALVFPDTSPRDVGFPEAGEIADIGYSAGFYLNATKAPWDKNWKMYDYISKELPEVIAANLPIDISRSSITGHSMGGHGALTIFLKNQSAYKSVSAFAPILHPTASSWGMYAFPRYLGMDQYTWKQYDTVELIKRLAAEKNLRSDVEFLIDQGTGDQFLNPDRLHTSVLAETIKSLGIDNQFNIRYHDGYDHGYFFISTFINDHIDHHAKAHGLSLKH
ncbi:hypothetical protein BGZ79_008729 [Entomortierella chlamydospora]|nr:hypothetical protein BGZ79_008729 [Entomortierella chlamydospora]